MLTALLDKLNELEQLVHDFKYDQDTVQYLARKLKNSSQPLKNSEEQVQIIENRISKRSKQLYAGESETKSRLNRGSVLKRQVTGITRDFYRFKTVNMRDKTFSEGVHAALV